MAGAIILLAFWGLICTGLDIMARGYLWPVLMLIGWGPLAALLWWRAAKSAKRDRMHAAVLEARGVPPGQGLDHAEDGTGIAIDRINKMLILISGRDSKGYFYWDVREWSARAESAAYVANMGSAQAIGIAARAEMDAKKATGLFVTVKDVDRPLWRVAMRDERTRARWMEILQQEINEGGVAA